MSATMIFPMAAIAAALFSYYFPAVLAGCGSWIPVLLGVVMLGMGMTLRSENFAEVCRRPVPLALGIGLQYTLMPLFGYLVSRLLGLPPELLVGMVLVGAAPGGTASNVICYLARGDVALSITMTTVSTLLSLILTPLMTWLYVGHRVAVPLSGMMLNILFVIVIPVSIGLLINHRFGRHLHPLKHFFPYLSALAIVVIIGIIVALNHAQLPALALPLLAAVFWHNALGLAGGYYGARLAGLDDRLCRTVAIEVGMQNSGLAVVLAQLHFAPLAALPGAIFSIWHNVSGAILAWYWSRRSGLGPEADESGDGNARISRSG